MMERIQTEQNVKNCQVRYLLAQPFVSCVYGFVVGIVRQTPVELEVPAVSADSDELTLSYDCLQVRIQGSDRYRFLCIAVGNGLLVGPDCEGNARTSFKEQTTTTTNMLDHPRQQISVHFKLITINNCSSFFESSLTYIY